MAKVFVDERIQNNKVMMFSKTTCPYCRKAKDVFKKLIKEGHLSADDFVVEEIENNPMCSSIQDYLNKITGARSVPRVFVDGKFIGGGDDVLDLDRKQKLVPMLKA